MCLQCCVDAQVVVPSILLGNNNAHEKSIDRLPWSLYVATKDGFQDEWPKDWYGLLRINDPDFVFPINIDNPDWDALHDAFYCLPRIGRDFYDACVRTGWNQSKYIHPETWFIHYVILVLKDIKTPKEKKT